MTVPAQTEIAPLARKIQLHPLSRRVMHWINAAAIIVMIASGWRIYDLTHSRNCRSISVSH